MKGYIKILKKSKMSDRCPFLKHKIHQMQIPILRITRNFSRSKNTSHTPEDDVGVEDGPSNPRFEIPRLSYCHLCSRSWPRAVGEWCHPDVEAAVLRTPPQGPKTWLGPRETASLLPLRPQGSSHWHGVEVVLLEAFHRRHRPLHNDPKFKFHSKTKTFFAIYSWYFLK